MRSETLEIHERNAFLNLLRRGFGSRMAAEPPPDGCGCGWARYVHTLRHDRGFRIEVKAARAVARENLFSAIHVEALGGNFQAAKYLLARQDADEAMRRAAKLPPPEPDPEAPLPSRAEIALRRQAARNRWGLPDELKTEIIHDIYRIRRDPTASDRLKQSVRSLAITIDRMDREDARAEAKAGGAGFDARDALLCEAEDLIDDA